MNIGDTVKKAPRWAWYVVGGVGVGAFTIRMLQNRTTSTTEAGDTGVTTGDAVVSGAPAMAASSPAGIIVPPVIIGGQGDTDTGGGAFAAVIDGATGLISTIGAIVAPVQQQNADLSQGLFGILGQQSASLTEIATGLVAGAGSPPTPQVQTPTPVLPVVPPTPPAVVTPPPTVQKQTPQCGSGYPFQQSPGDCFKKVCSDGKKTKDGTKTDLAPGLWHIHQNGKKVRMTTTKNSCW